MSILHIFTISCISCGHRQQKTFGYDIRRSRSIKKLICSKCFQRNPDVVRYDSLVPNLKASNQVNARPGLTVPIPDDYDDGPMSDDWDGSSWEEYMLMNSPDDID